MGIFLRGSMWWFEYRTSAVRVVRSTGFRKSDRAKAQAVYDAVRLGFRTRPQKSAMEGILGAIYGAVQPDAGLPLASVGRVYENWCRGKGRVVAPQTDVNRRNLLARFVAWADGRGVSDARAVSVAVARDFVAGLRSSGLSNKTLRTYAQYLGGIWRAVGQMVGDLHNPWPPACPDDDGSSVRRASVRRTMCATSRPIVREPSRADSRRAAAVSLSSGTITFTSSLFIVRSPLCGE